MCVCVLHRCRCIDLCQRHTDFFCLLLLFSGWIFFYFTESQNGNWKNILSHSLFMNMWKIRFECNASQHNLVQFSQHYHRDINSHLFRFYLAGLLSLHPTVSLSHLQLAECVLTCFDRRDERKKILRVKSRNPLSVF